MQDWFRRRRAAPRVGPIPSREEPGSFVALRHGDEIAQIDSTNSRVP